MLYEIWNLPRDRSTRAALSGDRAETAARLNPWLRWRPEQPAPTVLTVADLADCTCPDLCDRDHGND